MNRPVETLLVCAVFLAVGVAVVGDYGVGWDTEAQRGIVRRNVEFILGYGALPDNWDRYYGVAFELFLGAAECILGLEDTRSIYLSRHLLTHLFFLIGGFFCSLLAYRMSGDRRLALLALLLFLLHPRLYAPSFFNSKDLPFLSMFMIALYLTHRAFRKETVAAFLILGASVGVLAHLRIMGLVLFPLILGCRALDLLPGSAARRTQVLATGGAFAIAATGMLYVITPWLWGNPLELVTAWQVAAHHPTNPAELFQGRHVRAANLPAHFLPTWIAVSTPPATLLIGVLGAAAVCVRSMIRPAPALRNTDLRFGMLLLACFVLPMLAVIVLESHLYDGWRHMFFLHAPFCSLGVLGLHWTANIMQPARGRVAALWPHVLPALVVVGLTVTVVEMVRIHPHQYAYFNFLVDRSTPEQLRTRYEMDHRMSSYREGLEYLRRRYPDTTVHVYDEPPTRKQWWILPEADRQRLFLVSEEADFRIIGGKNLYRVKRASPDDAVYVRKVYGNTILMVKALGPLGEAGLGWSVPRTVRPVPRGDGSEPG